MPRRPRPQPVAERLELSPRLRAALASLEWPECGCNLFLMSVCLIGWTPGCRQRRHCGLCECDRRELPVCLAKQPHGCRLRRLGKECSCELIQLAECMANGCPDRREGRLCDCPRGPSTICRHMGRAERMRLLSGFQTLQSVCPAGVAPYDLWSFLQRELWPEIYADRELPGEPADLSDRAAAVAEMELRQTLGVGLYHPDDRRAPEGEAEHRRQLLQVRNFGLLVRHVEEVCHGAA